MKDIAFREQELNYWIENWNNPKVIKLKEIGHFPQEEAPEKIISELKLEQPAPNTVYKKQRFKFLNESTSIKQWSA